MIRNKRGAGRRGELAAQLSAAKERQKAERLAQQAAARRLEEQAKAARAEAKVARAAERDAAARAAAAAREARERQRIMARSRFSIKVRGELAGQFL